MTTKSTPEQIAQRSLDVAQKRVDTIADAIKAAEKALAQLRTDLADATADRDYKAQNPRLPKPTSKITTDATLTDAKAATIAGGPA